MFDVVLLNSLVVVCVVLIHYECLRQLSRLLPRLPIRPRLRIVLGVGGALVGHALEIWVFALAYYVATHYTAWGALQGDTANTLMDCVYYSFTVFTTLGFGDITPVGSLRYLTGIESLTGLVLITWTASFLFLEMQKHWEDRRP